MPAPFPLNSETASSASFCSSSAFRPSLEVASANVEIPKYT
uniref:GDT1-like protein 1 n=1 Tax=Rhizophora mucronata TaxID=61149 RepID=A0A2P2LLX7_RHIMU